MKTETTLYSREEANQKYRIYGGSLSLILFVGVLFFAVLGVMALRVEGNPGILHWFDLDRELNLVTLFSAGLLMANGWLVAVLIRQGKLVSRAWGLAAFFAFMAFDESLKIHETVEKWTLIDWQILYLPLLAVGGLIWWYVWWRCNVSNRWLWTMGALAWVVSQLIEAGQWGWWTTGEEDVQVQGYHVLMVMEEVLEMVGSVLFLIALFRMAWPKGWEFRKDSKLSS